MLGQEHTGWLRPEEGFLLVPRGPKNPDRAWPVLIHIPKGLLHHAEDGHKRRAVTSVLKAAMRGLGPG